MVREAFIFHAKFGSKLCCPHQSFKSPVIGHLGATVLAHAGVLFFLTVCLFANGDAQALTEIVMPRHRGSWHHSEKLMPVPWATNRLSPRMLFLLESGVIAKTAEIRS